MARKSLTDILHDGDRESLSRGMGRNPSRRRLRAAAAGRIRRPDRRRRTCSTSKTKGTPGYKLAFRVLEGDHQGRQFWHDVWLTPAALPMAKRDLAKLGVTALEQLGTAAAAGYPLPGEADASQG